MKKNKLRLFSDKKGYLFSFEKNFFPIKRVFFIQGKKNKICGNHAHKKLKQILVNIDAKAIIHILSKKINCKKLFLKSGEFLVCPEMTWIKIHFIKKGNIAVLCNKKYDKKDYIHNFNYFKRKIKK